MAGISERTAAGKIERQILISMIVNKEVLAMIAAKWQKDMFATKESNIIGSWCVQHFRKNGEAPDRAIEDYFHQWCTKRHRDDRLVDAIDAFLIGLHDQYKAARRAISPDHVLDQANIHFDRVEVNNRLAKAAEAMEIGDVAKAKELIQSFKPIDLNAGIGYDLMNDKERWTRTFEHERHSIIQYPGALGEFFGDTFERDGFVAFEGPEKRGKSWWLFDVCWRGMMDGRKVALFSVGDMSEHQVNRRFAIRAARRPMKPKTIRFPLAITHNEDDDYAEVEFEDRHYAKPLSKNFVWKQMQKWVRIKKVDYPLIRVSVHPAMTISAAGIHGIIQLWQNQDWTPDVIVIDYADILAPIDSKQDKINQINDTWAYLRRISQELHCCLVTATQTNKDSYTARTIRMSHYSNSKGKMAYPTAVYGINQDDTEKEKGIYRLNPVALREDECINEKWVYTASCLAIGNPAVRSTF